MTAYVTKEDLEKFAEKLVTKEDLARLERKLKGEIEAVGAHLEDMHEDIKAIKRNI